MGVTPSPNFKNKKGLRKNISENRKIRKPMMEKRRRERINACLTTLASILIESGIGNTTSLSLGSSKKKSRLEKADILEKTVNYWNKLEANNKQNCSIPQDKNASDGNLNDHFRLGYESCVKMVDGLLQEWEADVPVLIRNELTSHLKGTLDSLPIEQNEVANEQPSPIESQNEEETLTFVPELLPDGSLALIVRAKTSGESVLLERDSSLLYESNPNCLREMPDHSEIEDQIDFQARNFIYPNENFVQDANVWRPWF